MVVVNSRDLLIPALMMNTIPTTSTLEVKGATQEQEQQVEMQEGTSGMLIKGNKTMTSTLELLTKQVNLNNKNKKT